MPTETEQVEKVAQALYSADRCRLHHCPRKTFGWGAVDARCKDTYLRMAAAALAAMKEK